MNRCRKYVQGISLLEVVIAFAITAILVAVSMPNFQDHSARARVSEALLQAVPAQSALVRACMADNQAVIDDNSDAGFVFSPTSAERNYIDRVLLTADCEQKNLTVTVWTWNTGASPDPVIEWSASVPRGPISEGFEPPYHWNCRVIRGDFVHLPPECRKHHRKG